MRCTNRPESSRRFNDPQHRPDITPYLARLGEKRRVFPVGRLDYNTTGLLLLTNDGELALRLSHPRFGVTKALSGEVERLSDRRGFRPILRKGIRLEDGMTAPARVRVVEKLHKQCLGRNRSSRRASKREVRRMFEALGYFVEKLIRITGRPGRTGTRCRSASCGRCTQSEVNGSARSPLD